MYVFLCLYVSLFTVAVMIYLDSARLI